MAQGTRTDIMLNMVVVKENYFQIADVIRFAHQEGIHYINATPINLVAIPDIKSSDLKLYNSSGLMNELTKARSIAQNYQKIELLS